MAELADDRPVPEPASGGGGRNSTQRWPAVLLVALVFLSPWPFGSVHLRTTQAIAIIGSLAILLSLAAAIRVKRASVSLSPDSSGHLWVVPLAGLWLLGLLQLVPLPPSLHAFLAPGSAAVWHPAAPAAAAVLGTGPHPVSLDPPATLRWLAFSAAVVGLALISGPALRTRAILLPISVTAVAGGLFVAVYGLAARLLFGDKLYGVLTVPTIAPFGPFVSKNHFAGYVELAACLALGLAAGLADEARRGPERLSWLESRRAAWIVAAWGAATVLVLAVPVSLSRGGVVSLAAGIVAFVALRVSTRSGHRPDARTAIPAASGLIVVAVVLALLLPNEARERVRTLGDVQRADTYRLEVWRDALRLVASSPVVGSGFGAFADALPRFKTGAGYVRVEHAENDYLELLCEGGLAGFGLAVVAVATLLLRGWRAVRNEPHRLPRGVRAGALAGLVAMLVHSGFDFNLRIPSNALLAGLLLACVLPPSTAPATTTLLIRLNHAGPGRARGLVSLIQAVPFVLALALAIFGPWSPHEVGTGALQRAAVGGGPGLRRTALDRDAVAHLRRRPVDASAWAVLAWLRLPRAPQEAGAIAGWSQSLDPQHAALRAAAQRVRDAAARATAPAGTAPAPFRSQPRRP
jgi:O-antigen ligase